MSRRKLRAADAVAALIVIAIVVFVIAGPVTDNPPPTHAEYVAKADQVCTDIEEKQAELDRKVFRGIPYDESPPDPLWSEYAEAILPTFDEQVERLRKIEPPRGDKPKVDAYLRAVLADRALWQKVAQSPKNARLLDDHVTQNRADELGRKYGFRACAHAED